VHNLFPIRHPRADKAAGRLAGHPRQPAPGHAPGGVLRCAHGLPQNRQRREGGSCLLPFIVASFARRLDYTVRTRTARQWIPCPIGHRAPEAGEAEPVRFRVGELEEVRCRDETASFGKCRPSERKLMTGALFGRAGGKPQRSCTSSPPSSRRRKTGAVSVGQISSRGSRLGSLDDLFKIAR
jgi:hypothetical protein